MNELFLHLGIEHLKPLVTAVLLPPVPFIGLALIGIAVLRRGRRRIGSTLLLGGLVLIWVTSCMAFGNFVAPVLLHLPTALTEAEVSEMARHGREPVAIIVLGGGVEPWAPEYRTSSLKQASLERLRYGIWLGRRTGWPLGFSGGVGWGQSVSDASVSEAATAQRIATEEFRSPLRWVETESRDTRENARNTVALLRAQGINRVVLVTNAWHMQRAVRDFERAVGNNTMVIEAAPMRLATDTEPVWMRCMPSGDGMNENRAILREWLGLLSGA